MLLAIDIGGTFIKWAVSQEYSLTDARGKVPTPQDSFDSLVEAIAQIAEAIPEQVEGVAVSLPGTVDAATGLIVQGGALQYANGHNLVDALRDRLNLPSYMQLLPGLLLIRQVLFPCFSARQLLNFFLSSALF